MNFEEWYLDNREDAARDVLLDAFEAGAQSQQAKIDELQAKIDIYEKHVKTLKNIHENDFNEESESSYILGNLDGFFECIESDLKVARDD